MLKYEFLDSNNIGRYIEYLKMAIAEEPEMMWTEEADEQAIIARMIDPFYQNTKSILALDDSTVVGRIEYHFYGCIQDGFRMAYVDWVYVLPRYRHRGIAQQLFKRFEHDCAENSIDQYFLLRATNPGADKFYRSFADVELDDEPVLRKTLRK